MYCNILGIIREDFPSSPRARRAVYPFNSCKARSRDLCRAPHRPQRPCQKNTIPGDVSIWTNLDTGLNHHQLSSGSHAGLACRGACLGFFPPTVILRVHSVLRTHTTREHTYFGTGTKSTIIPLDWVCWVQSEIGTHPAALS